MENKPVPMVDSSSMMNRPITWAQVSLAAMEQLGDLVGRNPNAARLLLRLMKHMQDSGRGGVVIASRQTMKELLGCSMPTVERALRTLINESWVQRIKVGGANALAINSKVAWTDNRKRLDFAIFNATVIASRSEQDALALEPGQLRELPMVGRDELTLMVGPGMDPPSERELDGMPPLIDGNTQP